ncbi:MAG: two-component regulator propeller domain-containing protein [Flavobacteriales bacterium]
MKTLFSHTLLSLFLLLFPQFQLFAQQYEVEKYGLREGLSQANVTCIFQDSRGYIWAGTHGGGINRFDGNNFISYSQEEGLPGSIVRAIEEDAFGNLYVATSWGGVSKFFANKFTSITENTRDLSQPIALTKDSSNILWIATEGFIGYYDGKTSKIFSRFKETFQENIVDILFHPIRGLIVLSNSRIYQIKNFKLVPLYDLSEHDIFNPLNLQIDDRGSLIVLDKNSEGIALNSTGKATKLTVYHANLSSENKELLKKAKYLEIGGRGSYWYIIPEKGILQITEKDTYIYDEKRGIENASQDINQVFVDREENIWIGSDFNGLYKMTRWPFISFQKSHPLSSPSIFHIRKDKDDILWLNLDSKNVVTVNPVTYDIVSHPIINERVKEINAYNGNIYVATEKGIYRSKGTSLEKIPFQLPFEPILTTRILVDKNGAIWIGTAGKGLYKFEKGKTTNPINIEVGNNYVHSILETKSGEMYVGTGSGLNKIEGNNSIGLILELCNSYVGQITEDKFGNLWLATDNCISRVSGENVISYTVLDGLSSNTIYLLHCDKDGLIWSGTNKGLDKLEFDEDGNILSHKLYNNNNGFSGIECNSRGMYEDREGNLFIATVYGLYVYQREKDVINPFPPKIFITDLKLFMQDLPESAAISEIDWHGIASSYVLDGEQNHITIFFNAVALKLPSKTRFSYMLEGFDKTWSPPSDLKQTTYSNLQPGEYTFLVKAFNEDGVSSETISLKITVTAPPPPFWQNTWFFIISILIISYLAFYLIFLRNFRLQRATQILEQKIQDRTKEISKQNEEKAIMLKEIHHRVKNNLQIINSLLNLSSHQITDPDTLNVFQECRNRINSMALIHEKMYEVKDLANINIKEYITQLTESLVRTYQIDKKINLELDLRVKNFKLDTLVPIGLIINEAVSNSLKYAFNNQSEGKIFIQIFRDNSGNYNFTIGDNGVGLPPDFDWENSSKLGIQLIQILSEQLNATVEINRKNGTIYTIKFP